MNQYMVAYGSPTDGFTYVGPFKTHQEALTSAESERGDWWVIKLETPAQENGE